MEEEAPGAAEGAAAEQPSPAEGAQAPTAPAGRSPVPGTAGDMAAEAGDPGILETIVDAVSDAVDDVVGGEEVGEPEATTEITAIPGEPIAEEPHDVVAPEIWLVLALVALVVIAFRPAKRAILGSLDGRAGRIRGELEEAQRLREEAQAALANFQRRQRDAMSEADEIVGHARAEAERLRERAGEELETSLKRREAMAMDRIAQAEAAALAEIRAVAVDVAIAAARDLIADRLDKKKADGLIDQAIGDLPGKLH